MKMFRAKKVPNIVERNKNWGVRVPDPFSPGITLNAITVRNNFRVQSAYKILDDR